MAASGTVRRGRTDIARLEGLSPADIREIRAAGFDSVRALLDRIATDGFDAAVPGNPDFRRRVRRALARHALREADGKEDSIVAQSIGFLESHWSDLLLLLLLSAAIAGVVRAVL